MDAAAGSGATDAGSDTPSDGGNGGACTAASGCSSGFCVDGVCCETACGGACNACSSAKTGAADGLCRPITAATDPDNECAAAADQLRARRHLRRRRRLPQVDRRHGLLLESCSRLDGHAGPNLRRHGDLPGRDHRRRAATTSAAPQRARRTCAVERRLHRPATLLLGGGCTASRRRPTAGRARAASQCASGYCVDGVCCETACAAACSACSNAKTGAGDGLCRPVTAGTDPDNECAADATPAAAKTARAMAPAPAGVYAAGTACTDESCSGSTDTPARNCDGAGTCLAATTASCGAYMCGATACATTCTRQHRLHGRLFLLGAAAATLRRRTAPPAAGTATARAASASMASAARAPAEGPA